MNKPFQVIIIGRPNTGKSTLFNIIAGHRIAIMHETSGVTRDHIKAVVTHNSRSFRLVDSGGLFNDTTDSLNKLVHDKSVKAVLESDLILLLCDISGLTPVDEEIARLLRKMGRVDRTVLLLNKADRLDAKDYSTQTAEFHTLGLGDPFLVSSAHRLGVQDLLDMIVGRMPAASASPPGDAAESAEAEEEGDTKVTIEVCLIGKPNVGKSTLLNRLAGQELSIVHDKPGTTRDPVDTEIRYHGRLIRVVDTAGIRKKSRVTENIEYYSVNRAINNIRNTDITVLLLDPVEGLGEQEQKIISLVSEAHKGLIICINKWDMVEKNTSSLSEYTRFIRDRVPYLTHIPIVSISAMTGLRARSILDMILKVHANYNKRVETAVFNRFLKTIQPGGRLSLKAKIYYGMQVKSAPPIFQLFVNNEDNLAESRRTFIMNKLQEQFDFTGVFVNIQYKTSRSGSKT